MRYISYMMLCFCCFISNSFADLSFLGVEKKELNALASEILWRTDTALRRNPKRTYYPKFLGNKMSLKVRGSKEAFKAIRLSVTDANQITPEQAATAIENGVISLDHQAGSAFLIKNRLGDSFPVTLMSQTVFPNYTYAPDNQDTKQETIQNLMRLFVMSRPRGQGIQKRFFKDGIAYGYKLPEDFAVQFQKVLTFAAGSTRITADLEAAITSALTDGVIKVINEDDTYHIEVMGKKITWFRFFDSTYRIPQMNGLQNKEAWGKAVSRIKYAVDNGKNRYPLSRSGEPSRKAMGLIDLSQKFQPIFQYLGAPDVLRSDTVLEALECADKDLGAIWISYDGENQYSIVCGNGCFYSFQMTSKKKIDVAPDLHRGGDLFGALLAAGGKLEKREEKEKPYNSAQLYVQELIEDEFKDYTVEYAKSELEDMPYISGKMMRLEAYTKNRDSIELIKTQLSFVKKVNSLDPKAYHLIDFEIAKSVMTTGEEERAVNLLKHALEMRVLELIVSKPVFALPVAEVEKEDSDPHGNLRFLSELELENEAMQRQIDRIKSGEIKPANALMQTVPKLECLSKLFWEEPVPGLVDLINQGDVDGFIQLVGCNRSLLEDRFKDKSMASLELYTLAKIGAREVKTNIKFYCIVPMLFELWQLQEADSKRRLSSKDRLFSGVLLNEIIKELKAIYGPAQDGYTWWDKLNEWVSEAGSILKKGKIQKSFSSPDKLKEISTGKEAEKYVDELQKQALLALEELSETLVEISEVNQRMSELQARIERAREIYDQDPSIDLRRRVCQRPIPNLVAMRGRKRNLGETFESPEVLEERRKNIKSHNSSPKNLGISRLLKKRVSMSPEKLARIRSSSAADLVRSLREDA